ncbi:hypothetical protein [Nonomuraea angiospora]|uniref:hypothetical protein n=1 Tax=Nonomuraea angiospora TaxID=46172 RepID=UPI0029AF36DA|nr:hypothetical protein [Nonomuraea angiospora]MDX3101072.1 hypothetical protein [Nonomuraea angiospora]
MLYAAVNLIAFEIAAHPTGLSWYVEPWNDATLEQLDRAIAQARGVTFGYTLILAVEAVSLAVLDRPTRPSTVSNLLACQWASVMYLLTLALAVVVNPTTSPWRINDEYDVAMPGPHWYMPALISIGIATLTGLTTWQFARARDVYAELKARQP